MEIRRTISVSTNHELEIDKTESFVYFYESELGLQAIFTNKNINWIRMITFVKQVNKVCRQKQYKLLKTKIIYNTN